MAPALSGSPTCKLLAGASHLPVVFGDLWPCRRRAGRAPGGSVWMDTLLGMQTSYDIAEARKREGGIELALFEGRVA